jgi:bacillithiol system protein YtxJ
MEDKQIRKKAALEKALRADAFLLFKHSYRCAISARSFSEYAAFVESNSELKTGWIDVVGDRELSLWVATHTGIEHQSPQALWIKDGTVAWSANHFDITQDSLAAATRS